MNKFFVNKETYKERLDICRSCDERVSDRLDTEHILDRIKQLKQ